MEPGAFEARHADPLYCGDAFVLSQFELTGWTWAGDDEQQLAAARPVRAFHPEAAIAGLEPVCSTTFLMPVDGPVGTAAYAIAIVEPGGALEALEAWASANSYVARGQDDYVEHVRTGDGGQVVAKLMFRVLGEVVVVTDSLALEHTAAQPDDVIVTHIDFERR